jgi:hypothetical protein
MKTKTKLANPITFIIALCALGFAVWCICGCTIGRLDSDNLRAIPLSEVHRMDDKGFPINLFQTPREVVPDYRNGKPNALVCPDNAKCFQCSHEAAKRYEHLYERGNWDGSVVFLPVGQKP